MQKLVKNWICKNIIKILTIYKNSLENERLEFKNYLDEKIYFEIIFLIRLIKERIGEKWEVKNL